LGMRCALMPPQYVRPLLGGRVEQGAVGVGRRWPLAVLSPHTSRILACRCDLEPRGLISLRGIGKIKTSFLIGRKSGILPNFLKASMVR
jgi:hypothetical protein